MSRGGRPALRVIAVYTAADRHATFVAEAGEAVLIGTRAYSSSISLSARAQKNGAIWWARVPWT